MDISCIHSNELFSSTLHRAKPRQRNVSKERLVCNSVTHTPHVCFSYSLYNVMHLVEILGKSPVNVKLPKQKKGEGLLLEGTLTTEKREDPQLPKNLRLESVPFYKQVYNFILLFERQNSFIFTVT